MKIQKLEKESLILKSQVQSMDSHLSQFIESLSQDMNSLMDLIMN